MPKQKTNNSMNTIEHGENVLYFLRKKNYYQAKRAYKMYKQAGGKRTWQEYLKSNRLRKKG